jgi:predicted nucleic acid-binding protein
MPADSISGASVFVDTNVLLYSFDSRDPGKRAKAGNWLEYLWRTGAGRMSWQVLHEFYANAGRKLGVPASEAREAVAVFSRWRPAGMSMSVVERGWYWMDQAQLPYWDSLILASAERLGCSILLSEDFQTGRNFEGVRVVSPFAQSPESPAVSI